MSKRLYILGLFAVIAALFFVAPVESALALDAPAAKPTTCSDYVGITNRIVTCVRETLASAGGKFFDGFYPLVQRLIGGFLTLGIIIYGMMAAFGMMEKVSRDTFVLVIKLSMIGYFIMNVDWMYNAAIDTMDDLGGAVVSYAPEEGSAMDGATTAGTNECMKVMREASVDADGNEIPSTPAWLAMDCLIDSVIGIRPTAGSNEDLKLTKGAGQKWYRDNVKGSGMSRGLLNVLFSSMGTSIIGIIIAAIGFLFVYSLVFLIVKALFVYLMGYMGITFLMIFAPIFIPLVLFRKTKEYFDKWAKLVISFMLQPVLILAFISFSIMAIDLAVFSGEYSIMYRMAGEASRGSDSGAFNLNTYLKEKEIIKKNAVTIAQIRTSRDVAGQYERDPLGLQKGGVTIDCSQKNMDASPAMAEACKQFYAIQVWKDQIDWNKMAEVRNPPVEDPGAAEGASANETAADRKGRAISREILAATIFATLVVFMMNGLINIVSVIANGLIGEEFQSPNLASAVSRGGGGLTGSFNNATAGLNNLFKGGRK